MGGMEEAYDHLAIGKEDGKKMKTAHKFSLLPLVASILLVAFLLTSCQKNDTDILLSDTHTEKFDDTVTSLEPPYTEPTESVAETYQSEPIKSESVTTTGPPTELNITREIITYGVWIFTVKWGKVIPGTQYESSQGPKKDENNKPIAGEYLTVDVVAVEAEILKVWNLASGNVAAPYSVSEIDHLWVPVKDLELAAEGSTAVVLARGHIPDVTPYNDQELPLLALLGVTFTVSWLTGHGTVPSSNIFPIVDGTLQVKKKPDESWSSLTVYLFKYNDYMDARKNTNVPRFADGMTLEEFEQYIDSLSK